MNEEKGRKFGGDGRKKVQIWRRKRGERKKSRGKKERKLKTKRFMSNRASN